MTGKSLVWDLPTRLFHWTLTLSLVGSWVSAEVGYEWMAWHIRLGYVALTLIVFRLVWGFVGPHHARFSSFMRWPWHALRELPELMSTQTSNRAGHSHLGGWSIAVMLALVGIQAGSGLFITDDIFYAGPYNPAVSSDTAGTLAQVHRINFQLLQAMVSLHILIIVWYRWRKHTNLLAPMLSGLKSIDAADAIPSSKLLAGLAIAGLCAGGVALLVYLAPEPVYLF